MHLDFESRMAGTRAAGRTCPTEDAPFTRTNRPMIWLKCFLPCRPGLSG